MRQGVTGDLEFRGKRSTAECWREAGNPGSIRFNTSLGITEKNLELLRERITRAILDLVQSRKLLRRQKLGD